MSEGQLREAIAAHLRSYKDLFGADAMAPKFHYAWHMSVHYQQLNCLPNCFALERKHKSPKRFANLVTNTAGNWNIGVLRDVTANHLHSLWEADAGCFGEDPGLLMPHEPRPQLRNALQRELGIPGAVIMTAARARCN